MPIVGAPSTTAELILDPITEDATNVEVELSDDNNIGLIAHNYPNPPLAAQWASSVSTEGAVLSSQKHENRTITLQVEVTGLGALSDLEAKVAKLYRDGGTLQRTFSDGRVFVYDILTVQDYDATFEQLHHLGGVTPVTIALICMPYARRPEVTATLTPSSETTLPALIGVVNDIEGDMPALGRLEITDTQGQDQQWAMWAIQSRNYSSAATAALFYEAEGRTALGGAATAVGASGASGSGSNVVRQGSLTPAWQAMLSTQASGGGAHLTHVGTFRIYARVQVPTTNTGAVSVALQWAQGDFVRVTRNATVTFDVNDAREGRYVLIDLGLVAISEDATRWEGRIIATSTVVGDDLDVDHLIIAPVDEGYGVAQALRRLDVPTAFTARDEFNQTAGALTGKTAPVGGNWAGAGDADDFTVNATDHVITRAAVSDAGDTGRYVVLGSAVTTSAVQVDFKSTNGSGNIDTWHGVLLRYTDVNNWLAGRVNLAYQTFEVVKRVAGTITKLYTGGNVSGGAFPAFLDVNFNTAYLYDSYFQLLLTADTAGRWVAWAGRGTIDRTPVALGLDTDLATGGALASGKVGIIDEWTHATPQTRTYDNFAAYTPTQDAAIFANQSLRITHQAAQREDAAGTNWNPLSIYEGNLLRLPPAGAEGRSCRVLVKATRHHPTELGDTAIDDISAALYYTPRYLVIPEA